MDILGTVLVDCLQSATEASNVTGESGGSRIPIAEEITFPDRGTTF